MRRISFGMTTRPSSSMRRTIPVAFICVPSFPFCIFPCCVVIMWKRKGNIHLPALCLPNRGGYDTINLLQKGWAEDAADFDFGRRRSRSGRCAGGSTDRRGPRTHHRAGQKREGGQKLLATGNGRCNLDNRDITPERYFTSSPKALRRLLSAVDEAAPLAWFESLGLYPRTDEAGRVYPYSNQAADVLALLEHHLSRLGVEVCTGCTVQNLSQSRGAMPSKSRPRQAARPCGPTPSSAPWAVMPAPSSAPMASAPGSPPSAVDGWPPLSLPDGPAVCSSPQAAGRHPGQGLRQPAGRCRWPGACPGNGRGAVHRIRAFGHLHHAAFGPAGPGTLPEAACRGPRPLPCFE